MSAFAQISGMVEAKMDDELRDAYGNIVEQDRHEVFVNDDGIVPTCDICGGPQRVEGDNWNGETGNHFSCEENTHDHPNWSHEFAYGPCTKPVENS